MSNRRILFALYLIGFYAILSQVLLIREFLIVFSGNELSIGIFLGNWLLLEAFGSFTGGKVSKKTRQPVLGFAILQLLLAFCLPLLIYVIRIINVSLATSSGELASIPTIFFLSILLLSPIAFINGAQFSLGCRLLSSLRKDTAGVIGNVYVYEAIGSIVGGIVVTYICLGHLNTFQSAFLLSILSCTSALLLLSKDVNIQSDTLISRTIRALHFLLIAIFVLLIITGGSKLIHYKSIEAQWPGYQIIAYQNSIYGNAVLLEREEQFELLSNGVPLLSLPTSNISEIEEMAHLPLLFHSDPKSVLLVGGGLNGILREMAKYPLEKIDYAELDPVLTDIVLLNIPGTGFDYLEDDRIKLHKKDGRHFLLTNKSRYDILVLNLPDPSTLEINRFYTKEFFSLCKDHLTSSGILCFRLPGGASYLNEALLQLNACILESQNTVFQFRRIFPFESTTIFASNDKQILSINQDTVSARIKRKQIEALSLSDRYLEYLFNSLRSEQYKKENQQLSSPDHNSDFKPIAVYFDLLYWNSILSPSFSKIYAEFKNIKFTHLVTAISLIFILLTIFPRSHINRRRIAVGTVIATSGFTGMGLTLIMILTFQAILGYVYFWIGMIISSFMLGLAIGGKVSTKWWINKKNPSSLLLASDITLVIYFIILLLVYLLLNQFIAKITAYDLLPVFMLFGTGIYGLIMGTQFPLAGRILQKKNHEIAETAGILYSLDLFGAWSAGMVVSLFLIPLLGLIETIIIFTLIKGGSVIILFFSDRIQRKHIK